jgi:hypothetical protein
VLAVTVGLVFWFAAVKADATLRSTRQKMLLYFLLAVAYGYGSGVTLNTLLDRSLGHRYETGVTDKHVNNGRRTDYYFQIQPWGPKQSPYEDSVPNSLYRSVEIGNRLCVDLYSGAMRIQWYTYADCTH